MCVRSRAVPSATRTPALSGSMSRLSTALKPTLPRNSEVMLLPDYSHPKTTERTKGNTARAAWTAGPRARAPLEEWMTAYRSNLSRLRTLL